MSTSTPTPPQPTPSTSEGHSNNSGPTSSPLLFFVALGFGVVFTNLWIIVGVKYCFRYNQRNRRQQHDENGEPIDMTTMPRTHRRRREKKLMTMDEVNDRFPLTKYKAWMASRAEQGLPTAGGVAAPHIPTASVRDMEGATSAELHRRSSEDSGKPGALSPLATHDKEKEKIEKEAMESPKYPTSQAVIEDAASPSTDARVTQSNDNKSSTTAASSAPAPQPPPIGEASSQPHPVAPTRQEVHDNDDMDDDDQIQIAVPSELLANPGDSCAICIDTLEDDDDVRGLSCGHAFHASCLDPWLTSRRACCPLCKADYYVPKPRVEGDAAAEADRHAGRRPPGFNSARADGVRQPQYAFMSRRDGRPRMILPGRFMTIGHFDDTQGQRYGFPTVQRQPRPSGWTGDHAGEQGQQPNTWRSRVTNLTARLPKLPSRASRSNNAPVQQTSDETQSNLDTRSDAATVSHNPTPGQLEAGHRG
ncbi:MAG: hypothetical protein Q9184_007518 [Pyrenodesmia sp. 2 TL-2023]